MDSQLHGLHGRFFLMTASGQRLPSEPGSFLKGIVKVEDLESDWWKLLVCKTTSPLLPVLQPELEYEYRFLFRESQLGDRFALLAESASLVEALIEMSGLRAHLGTPLIKVREIVRYLAKDRDLYRLGTTWSGIEGFGESLRIIALYGDDLADSSLFLRLLPNLWPFRVQLRDPVRLEEIVTYSSKGDISIPGVEGVALDQVDSSLLFLRKRGFIDWEL